LDKLRTISKKHNWLIVSLGVALAAYILLPIHCENNAVSDQVEQEENQTETQVSELKAEAVPSASQEPVERNSYLIETLPKAEEKEDDKFPFSSFIPSPSKVFEVLFEHILSPNSP